MPNGDRAGWLGWRLPPEPAGPPVPPSMRPVPPPPTRPQQVVDAILDFLRGAVVGGETAASPRAAQAGELAMAGLPLLGAGAKALRGIRAYHGTPHTFPAERLVRHASGLLEYVVGAPDVLPPVPQGATVVQDFPLGRFRMAHVGTGEGGAAYGHGLYQAEEPLVAGIYRGEPRVGPTREVFEALRALDNLGFTYSSEALAAIRRDPVHWLERWDVNPARSPREAEAVATLERYLGGPGQGRVYETRINVDPATLLDWDRLMTEQTPQVREAFARAYGKSPAELASWAAGRQGYGLVGHGDPVQASTRLREAGVPGLRYLDQVSRMVADLKPPAFNNAAKQWEVLNYRGQLMAKAPTPEAAWERAQQEVERLGTRNYVMFDDRLIDILRKWGFLPPLAAGALYQATGQAGPAAQEESR